MNISRDYMLLRKDILVRLATIEGKVVTQTPLRVGAGRDSESILSIAQQTLLRVRLDDREVPVVPGSSWKGLFRSTGERILRGKGLDVCTGLTKQTCVDRIEDELEKQLKENKYTEALKLVWEKTCLNCKVFGAPHVKASASFFDSYPESYEIGVRPMIAIDRESGSVAKKALVTMEYVEPGSVFNFKVEVMNPTNYVLGYILSVMDQIQKGNVQVGGNKSRGFGVVKFKDVKLKMESYANYELPEMDPIDEIVNLQYPVDISIGEQNDAFKRLVDVFNSFMTKGVKK